MEELINNLAEKVADFIKDNAAEIPKWIGQSGLADKLPGGIGDAISGFLGGDKN